MITTRAAARARRILPPPASTPGRRAPCDADLAGDRTRAGDEAGSAGARAACLLEELFESRLPTVGERRLVGRLLALLLLDGHQQRVEILLVLLVEPLLHLQPPRLAQLIERLLALALVADRGLLPSQLQVLLQLIAARGLILRDEHLPPRLRERRGGRRRRRRGRREQAVGDAVPSVGQVAHEAELRVGVLHRHLERADRPRVIVDRLQQPRAVAARAEGREHEGLAEAHKERRTRLAAGELCVCATEPSLEVEAGSRGDQPCAPAVGASLEDRDQPPPLVFVDVTPALDVLPADGCGSRPIGCEAKTAEFESQREGTKRISVCS
eukprot:1200849-Prymnesium_polylepis.1